MLLQTLLSEVCKDVATEPKLLPLTGEEFDARTTNKANEARMDVRAAGFWVKGQKAFLDIRVFDPNASRYHNQAVNQCYLSNEKEKKRHYNDRVLQVD